MLSLEFVYRAFEIDDTLKEMRKALDAKRCLAPEWLEHAYQLINPPESRVCDDCGKRYTYYPCVSFTKYCGVICLDHADHRSDIPE